MIHKDDRVIDPGRISHGRVEQGTVLEIRGEMADVRWDGGTQSIQHTDTLRKTDYPISITPGNPGYVGYPKNDMYQWGEFAVMAVECGGYSDMSLVDPMTGTRFWVGEVLADGPTWYEAMHRVISAAERADFIERCEDRQGLREEARLGRAPTEKEIATTAMMHRHEAEQSAMMQRHVAERAEFFRHYDEAGVTPPAQPDGADAPSPAV